MPKTLCIFDLENIPLSKLKEKIEQIGDAYDYLLFFGYGQRIKHLPVVSTIEILQADGMGHNYLDFQLVSELTIRANSGLYSDIIVISNDTGFDAVINYLSRYTKVNVSRQGEESFLKIKKPKIKVETISPVVVEETPLGTFSKTYVQNKLKYLIERGKNTPKINRKLYNFILHTPEGGCIKTAKEWKELIKVEFNGVKPERIYNALKKGGLIEKHNANKNRLNLSKTNDTIEILKTIK